MGSAGFSEWVMGPEVLDTLSYGQTLMREIIHDSRWRRLVNSRNAFRFSQNEIILPFFPCSVLGCIILSDI